jgi:hypothetical protein
MMPQKLICCLCLILVSTNTPYASSSSSAVDVFWLDRYGNISWEDEKARLDNFAIHILENSNYVGYIFVNAGRRACKDEAPARAVRAKKYMVEVRGVPPERVVWRDLGYRDEAEVVFYLFKRNAPIPYNPEYERAKEGQIIEDCSVKTRKQRKRGHRHPAPNNSLNPTPR